MTYEDAFADGYDWAKVVVNVWDGDSDLTDLQREILQVAVIHGDKDPHFRNLILDKWRGDDS